MLKKAGWWVRSTPTLPPSKQASVVVSSADIIGINQKATAAFFEVKTAPKGTLQIGGTDTGWKIHQINWTLKIQEQLGVVVWLPVMFDGIDSPFPRIKRALYIIPADALLDYWYTWGSVQSSLVYAAKKNYAIEFQKNQVDAVRLFAHYAAGYNANDRWTVGPDHPRKTFYL